MNDHKIVRGLEDAIAGRATRISQRCGCASCAGGVTHAAGCAVHNWPALPSGPCDCGAIADGYSPATLEQQAKDAIAWLRGDNWFGARDAADIIEELLAKSSAAETERERCARIAETIGQETGDGEGEIYIARKIATAIRSGDGDA